MAAEYAMESARSTQALAYNAAVYKAWAAINDAKPPPAHWFSAAKTVPPTEGALNSTTKKGQ